MMPHSSLPYIYDAVDAALIISNPAEAARIMRSRQNKKKLQLAAARFNAEGKKAFPFLQGLKVLSDPLTPASVVAFLYVTLRRAHFNCQS